ncbi:MAG: glucosidase [Chitinophagaceae bacterium]|nr:glucosidase [Chitinophagaceae bacterium]
MKEKERLKDVTWKKWGPYLSERQWGTVREDYSVNGEPWISTTHDMARSKAWRWGEDGLGGFSDKQQLLCFCVGLWNEKDPIIKERLFGLSGYEGNHGEDVKELYYYLDSSPTHSYMKMLYKYPQDAFPYHQLVEENSRRSKNDPEFELIDTGLFDEDRYFDVFIEYAKAEKEDILIRITIHNRGKVAAPIHVLPTIWFRNTWDWGYDDYKPRMMTSNEGDIIIEHKDLGEFTLSGEERDMHLFCDNETNVDRLYGVPGTGYFKDGINEYIVGKKPDAVNYQQGTKAAVHYQRVVPPGESVVVRLRLQNGCGFVPFSDFDLVLEARRTETDEFYNELQAEITDEDEKRVQRQAFAGMLWSKQLYYYNVHHWLTGDPRQPPPPSQRLMGRNHEWKHLNNRNIISMPDKWEYPWYAAWDLGFHCIALSLIDPDFAKHQLLLLTHDWYMHPNGQLPAYEWSFSDTNPPVHAWAAYRVYELEKHANGGKGDIAFLETVFHKLLLNFTWWVNRKDQEGNNIFEGGFLGMDNIGIFDRSNTHLPFGGTLEQADGTSWMATYSLNLMRIALELSMYNPTYQDMANKFFEHFLHIASAIANIGEGSEGLWDAEDEFYYDTIRIPGEKSVRVKTRSAVGLAPLFAVEVIDDAILQALPEFAKRLNWLLDNRPDLAALVSRWHEKGSEEKHLLSLLRGHRIKRLLYRMLDETEFLSEYGVRTLSKYHEQHPYELRLDGQVLQVKYVPGESDTNMFGGNSNWRGPIWIPINFLIIESLQRFHHYYGDDFKVEYPTHSGRYHTLNEISVELTRRLAHIFLRDDKGRRATFGSCEKMQHDPHFKDYILFFEYFHGDNGKGLGASHQTGWTGLITKLLMPRKVVVEPAARATENT